MGIHLGLAALGQTRGAMALVVTLFFIMEAVVLVVGGLSLGQDLLMGLLFLSSFWLGMLLWNAFHLPISSQMVAPLQYPNR